MNNLNIKKTALVTGANGHLGFNLVKTLLNKNYKVIAGVRSLERSEHLKELNCEIRTIDLLNEKSLINNLKDADVLFQVAANFNHWAKNPEKEIYNANLLGTKNVLTAASINNFKKVVYVSSLGAANRLEVPITEKGWNSSQKNIYFKSKVDSEKLAWELAKKLSIDMVSVLPGAMIGGDCYNLTPTMKLLSTILNNKLSGDPQFYFNFVDVEDVALACIIASEKGRSGERYLLANEECTSVVQIVKIAQSNFPERKIKTPPVPPEIIFKSVVYISELLSNIRGVEPELQSNFISEFRIKETCNIEKARSELGFNPKSPQISIEKALKSLAVDILNKRKS